MRIILGIPLVLLAVGVFLAVVHFWKTIVNFLRKMLAFKFNYMAADNCNAAHHKRILERIKRDRKVRWWNVGARRSAAAAAQREHFATCRKRDAPKAKMKQAEMKNEEEKIKEKAKDETDFIVRRIETPTITGGKGPGHGGRGAAAAAAALAMGRKTSEEGKPCGNFGTITGENREKDCENLNKLKGILDALCKDDICQEVDKKTMGDFNPFYEKLSGESKTKWQGVIHKFKDKLDKQKERLEAEKAAMEDNQKANPTPEGDRKQIEVMNKQIRHLQRMVNTNMGETQGLRKLIRKFMGMFGLGRMMGR